jgi:hypothetical protein
MAGIRGVRDISPCGAAFVCKRQIPSLVPNWSVEIELVVFDPSIVDWAAARTKELLYRVV